MGRKVILDDTGQDVSSDKPLTSKHMEPDLNDVNVCILTTQVSVSKDTRKVRPVLSQIAMV